MEVTIRGTNPPGRTWCDHADIHVALQVGKDPDGAVPADTPAPSWTTEVRVVVDGDGGLDFRGAAVHGKRGGRFLYLTWGDVVDGRFEMFRRAKLVLADVDAALVRSADRNGTALVAEVDLTDERGGPRCARVDPPAVRWSTNSFG